MDKDEQSWDYYEQLQSSQNGKYNYDVLLKQRLIKFNEISIPKAIYDSINHRKNIKYFGGFFESINRCYFIIDSSIYLWDYSNINRWCCLNQFNHTINSICLVKSKKNIFKDKIKYLLIVATKLQIIIIGIGFTNDSINGEIEAFPTKYILSTDNSNITKIIADKYTKRIFLSCDKGNIYEFEYFYKQNFFGQHIRKCIKTNISDSFTSKLLKSFTFQDKKEENNNSSTSTSTSKSKSLSIIDLVIHNDIFGTKCLFSLSNNGDINGYKFYEYNKHKVSRQPIKKVNNNNNNDDNNDEEKKEKEIEEQEQENDEILLNDNENGESVIKILSYSYKKLENEIFLQIEQMSDDNSRYFFGKNNFLISLHCINNYESQHCQLMGITSNGDRLFFTISNNNNSSSRWIMELSFIRIRPPFLNYKQQIEEKLSFQPTIQTTSPKNVKYSFYKNGLIFMNSLKNNNYDCLLLIYRNNVETQRTKWTRTQLIESVECDMYEQSAESDDNNNEYKEKILSITEMPFEKYLSSSSFMLYSQKEIKKLNFGLPFIGLSQFSIEHLLPSPIYLCLKENSICFYKLERFIDKFKLLLKSKNYANIIKFIEEIGITECKIMCLLILINEEKDNDIIIESNNLFKTNINKKADFVYHDIMIKLQFKTNNILSIHLCLSRILRPIWSSTICILDINNNNIISARYSFDELFYILKPLKKFKLILNTFNNDNNNNNNNNNNNKNDYKNIIIYISKCIEIINILLMLTRCQFNYIYDNLSSNSQILLKQISFQQLLIKIKGKKLLQEIIKLLINKLNTNDIEQLHNDCPSYFTSAQFMTFVAKSKLNNKSTLENALKLFINVCDDDTFNLKYSCNLLKNVKYFNGVIKLVFTLQEKLFYKIQILQKQQESQQQYQQQSQSQSQSRSIILQINELKHRIINAWNEIFQCLQILFIDENIINNPLLHHQQERALQLCLQQENRDFSYKLYQWFLDNKLLTKLFKFKPKYLEMFLSENIYQNIDDETIINKQKINKERNKRLMKLVHFYKENNQILKMIKLLDALTKTNGFQLNERNNFLIEAKRATKLLNNNNNNNNNYNINFDPHNVNQDKYNKFEQKSILCQIQLNVLNELRFIKIGNEQDLFELDYKLLNLDKIYEISKKYELYEYCLDCLSFINDPSVKDHVHGCWLWLIAKIIKINKTNWTQYLQLNFYKIVNKYNLQQQPWMFDINKILFYLNDTNLKTHKIINNKIIIDCIYPNIKNIKYQQLLNSYKYILNQIDQQFKINIIKSIYYLITLSSSSSLSIFSNNNNNNNNNNNSNVTNPRLLLTTTISNNNDNNNNITINIQDLISNCINYLERQNIHHINTETIDLKNKFENLNFSHF